MYFAHTKKTESNIVFHRTTVEDIKVCSASSLLPGKTDDGISFSSVTCLNQ